MSRKKLSYEQLGTAATLCAGVAMLIGVAVFLGQPGSLRVAVESESVTAATPLGFTQGLRGFNVTFPHPQILSGVGLSWPGSCNTVGSQLEGNLDCPSGWGLADAGAVTRHYLFSIYNGQYGYVDGFSGVTLHPKASPVPVGVLSVHPQGDMTGMSKTGWYRDPDYGARGQVWTQPQSDVGCATQYQECTEFTYECNCTKSGCGTCTDTTCTPGPFVWGSSGPWGAMCYRERPPAAPGTSWSWQTQSYGSAVSVPVGSTITVEWSCQTQFNEHFSYDCGAGNVCGGNQNRAQVFPQGGVLYRDGAALGISGQVGQSNVTVPATAGTYNYQVTCQNNQLTSCPGGICNWSLFEGDDLTLSIPVTVTAAPDPVPSLTPVSSSVPSGWPQTLSYSLTNPTGVIACLTRESTQGIGTGYVSAIGSGSTTTKPITASTGFYYDCFKSPTWYSSPVATVTATVGAPSLTTNAATSITSISATLNASITATNGANATSRGFARGTTANLTGASVSTSSFAGSFGIGAFNESVGTLSPNTTYYFRAYATNANGVGLGTIQPFTTSGVSAPSVTTNATGNITATTATLNGNITATGGANATQHGFALGTSPQLPTASTATTTLGAKTGTGTFSQAVGPLVNNTTYYVRAYATNAAGTSYGNPPVPFTAQSAPGVITGGTDGLLASCAVGSTPATTCRIARGTQATLSWTVTNMATCGVTRSDGGTAPAANNAANGSNGAHSAPSGVINAETTFTLSCTGLDGLPDTATAKITLIPIFREE